MKRILILGNCGVGKTTFSRKLANQLNLPLIHLDQYYWQAGWTRPSTKEWRAKVSGLVKKKQWIIEGNYRNTFDLRIPESDTIIFLDFPRPLAVWRTMKRFIQSYGKRKPELGGNNAYKLDFPFLKWILTFPRKEMLSEIERYRNDQKLILIKSSGELSDLLNTVGNRILK